MKLYLPSASDHSFFLSGWGRDYKNYNLVAQILKFLQGFNRVFELQVGHLKGILIF